MEQSNKTLLLSLTQDLKEVNRIALEIIKYVGPFELNSWLYPSRDCKEKFDVKDILQNEFDVSYILCLELIIDRLYLLIYLLRKFLTSLFIVIPLESRKNVQIPKQITLGTSVNLLWTSLLQMRASLENHNGNLENIGSPEATYDHKEVQTETGINTNNVCNTCSLYTTAMKKIVNELQKCDECSSVRATKKSIREDIFNITQAGCMNRLATSISEDVHGIVNKLSSLENNNKQYKLDLENLNIKYANSTKTITTLQEKCKLCDKNSGRDQVRCERLKLKYNEIYQEHFNNEQKLALQNDKIKELQNCIDTNVNDMSKLKQQIDEMQENIRVADTNTQNSLNEVKIWKTKFKKIYTKYQIQKTTKEEVLRNIRIINEHVNVLRENYRQIDKQIDENQLQTVQKLTAFDELLKSLKDAVDTKVIQKKAVIQRLKRDLEQYQKQPPSILNTKKIAGDPITDMKTQIESNENHVKQLLQENQRLFNLIKSIECRKITNQCPKMFI